jgi:Tol biopolymer transport system component
MQNLRLICLIFICICPGIAFAKISLPKEVVARPSAHCQAPLWSPDGKSLAVDIYNPKKDSREVWVIKLSNTLTMIKEEQVAPLGQKTSRLNGGKAPPVIEFAWTPDMDMLSPPYVFSSQGLNRKNFDIYADGNWLTAANRGNDGQPAFSADSNYLAYTSQQKDSGDIMLIDFNQNIDKPIRLTKTPYATEYNPQWHPTRSKLLFIRSQKNRGQDIVLIEDVRNPKTSERILTDWSADEVRAHWSPNGEWVAFYSNQKSGNDKIFDLWVIKADGSSVKRLAKDIVVDDHKGVAWAPDNQTIFYVKRDFKTSNPIMWAHIKSSKTGLLIKETQMNSDLTIHHRSNGEMALAFRSVGLKGSAKKTWHRVYVVTFRLDDLK